MNEFGPKARKDGLGTKIIWALLIVVMIAICAAIVYPAPGGGGRNAVEGACKDNLRTIDGAIMQYRAGSNAYSVYTSDYVPAFLKQWPACPEDGRPYVIVADGPGSPPQAYCPNGHTY